MQQQHTDETIFIFAENETTNNWKENRINPLSFSLSLCPPIDLCHRSGTRWRTTPPIRGRWRCGAIGFCWFDEYSNKTPAQTHTRPRVATITRKEFEGEKRERKGDAPPGGPGGGERGLQSCNAIRG